VELVGVGLGASRSALPEEQLERQRRRWTAGAPRVVATFQIESSPRVWGYGDVERVMDWINAHPEYRALLDEAARLQREHSA
jgi:hypothetical protein